MTLRDLHHGGNLDRLRRPRRLRDRDPSCHPSRLPRLPKRKGPQPEKTE